MKKAQTINAITPIDLTQIQNIPADSPLSLNHWENYSKFLFMVKKYPKLKAVPTKAIDNVWHHHLNHSMLYQADCLNYFGRLVTHSEQLCSMEYHIANYKLTGNIWFELFNEPYGNEMDMAFCGVDGDGAEVGQET